MLALVVTATACLDDANCADLKGVYPPESVTVVGSERVEAPFASWGCGGYDSGPLVDGIPDLPVGPAPEVRIEVPLTDGGTLEVRAFTSRASGDWT